MEIRELCSYTYLWFGKFKIILDFFSIVASDKWHAKYINFHPRTVRTKDTKAHKLISTDSQSREKIIKTQMIYLLTRFIMFLKHSRCWLFMILWRAFNRSQIFRILLFEWLLYSSLKSYFFRFTFKKNWQSTYWQIIITNLTNGYIYNVTQKPTLSFTTKIIIYS